MKTPLAVPNAMNRLRMFLIAACLLAVTPPLFGDIILVSRLSDAEAYASAPGGDGTGAPQPQSQTGFLPANLCNRAYENNHVIGNSSTGTGTSTSNSSILSNNPIQGLRVVGDGTAGASVNEQGQARGSAKLIVLNFTLTEPHPYSITGQLHGAFCEPHFCSKATAKLTGETGTIFEVVGTTLNKSGTLSPGNYTLSVDVYAFALGLTTYYSSDANFDFWLAGTVSIPTPTPTPIPVTRATNLSTRLLNGTREVEEGIGGFIITGTGRRHLLIRGIGPSLSGIIANTLPDPLLVLHTVIDCLPQSLVNVNWRDTQEAEIIATGRAPGNNLESAIVADFSPGAYTVRLRGGAGVGLVEIYDLSTNQDSKLANISTRGKVGTGDDIMIAGFILGGASGEDSIIVRGLGVDLSYWGLSALPDPKLELRNSQGALIASNDNWMDDPSQAAIIQAAGLAPTNNLESAIAATLLPGPYTALLSGVNNGTGAGLVEVYELGTSAH
ncbi:MAG: hypothetical protein DMF06_11545 [Verrucomicrobia bacterium]|nr:MAG: hypothetical protein DMF06_11545 [Verrucomicrobiota bacterium]